MQVIEPEKRGRAKNAVPETDRLFRQPPEYSRWTRRLPDYPRPGRVEAVMTRLLAILILLVSGLPRLGVASADGHSRCDGPSSLCQVTRSGCCSNSTDGNDCPMSDGPCQCAATPAPQPEPNPKAPPPSSDRGPFTGLLPASTRVTFVAEPEHTPKATSALVHAFTAGRTHHEIQALLGIWRT